MYRLSPPDELRHLDEVQGTAGHTHGNKEQLSDTLRRYSAPTCYASGAVLAALNCCCMHRLRRFERAALLHSYRYDGSSTRPS